jgi:hypothetical protein
MRCPFQLWLIMSKPTTSAQSLDSISENHLLRKIQRKTTISKHAGCILVPAVPLALLMRILTMAKLPPYSTVPTDLYAPGATILCGRQKSCGGSGSGKAELLCSGFDVLQHSAAWVKIITFACRLSTTT